VKAKELLLNKEAVFKEDSLLLSPFDDLSLK